MTLKQLIARKRTQLATLMSERSGNVTELAELRGNDNLTAEQEARVDALRTRNAAIDGEATGLETEIASLEAELAADDAADARSQVVTGTGAPSPSESRAPAVVTNEARTYAAETDARGAGFERDVAAAFLGDYDAQSRLQRHMQEERVERGDQLTRAAGTGAFAGLTVPQYLVDLYAPAAAARRPFADAIRHHDLPATGMTVNISRITTATSVALQATENSNVSETDIDDTLLTIPVQTAAGQQTLSRQAIERGSGVEAVVLDDLFRRYATTLDSTLINQSTTGLSAMATAIAYTDGTPTAAELYPKILQCQGAVEGALLDQASGEMLAVMHSRRWYWMQSQVSTSWPFLGQPGLPTQQGGTVEKSKYGSGVRGQLPNSTPVIVDNNIPTNLGAGTNEDELYLVDPQECHLWEDPSAPMFIRAEQTKAASLGVLLVVYGYFAYTFGRLPHAQKINGTGLITPTF
jgi:hypothetical protein